MDRRVLALGVLMILASLLWGVSSAPSLPTFNATSSSTVSVASNGYASGQVALNQSSLLVLSYASSNTINFYLLNSSGANYLTAQGAGSLYYRVSQNLSVPGLISATLNATKGSTPYVSNYSSYGIAPPTFSSGNSSVLLRGTYYFLFANARAVPVNVSYSYTVIPLSSVAGSGLQTSLQGSIAPALLFIAAIFVLVFGMFMSKKKQDGPDEDEVKKLYAKIDKKPKKRQARK